MCGVSQVDLTSVLEVEKNIINAFACLVIKLSEASFRPVFLKVSVDLTANPRETYTPLYSYWTGPLTRAHTTSEQFQSHSTKLTCECIELCMCCRY